MTTMAERLKRLAALEAKLKAGRSSMRLAVGYAKVDEDGYETITWPNGEPAPDQERLVVAFIKPTHGGRPPVPEGERHDRP